MERKTKIEAAEGRHDLLITREFDLPVELVFKAYTDADILGQWMTTNVVKLDSRTHGGYQYETRNDAGEVVFRANGTIHELVPGERIVRTFEMENAPFSVQLEFLDFTPITDLTSKLSITTVFRSPAHRDQMLALPFAWGLNMAHDRLEQVVTLLTANK